MKVRIGTRGSDLALWQARFVAERLETAGHAVAVDVLKTRGDRIDDVPLHQVEGKAFFTAEIEDALRAGRVDIAVHSHKDLPVESPPGLAIAAVPPRGPAGERLVVAEHAWSPEAPFVPLADGAVVGTSAPRRTEQLRLLRPDLDVQPLRGNVPTRVKRVHERRYDAVLLAAAGLDRLELDLGGLRAWDVPQELVVPAPAQGALAVQTRADDEAVRALCRALFHDAATAAEIEAERGVLLAAGGGCSLPLGCAVTAEGGGFTARAFLAADHPAPGAPARWVEAVGADPAAAARAVQAQLASGEAGNAGPLSGLALALVGSASGGSRLGARLAVLGARVAHDRVLGFEALECLGLAGELQQLPADAWVAVTSREAARRLAAYDFPIGARVAAVGASTASVLREIGIEPAHIGSGGAWELARSLPVQPGTRVFFPCAEGAGRDLEDGLAERGARVLRRAIYRTVPLPEITSSGGVDARVYMSPSAVEASRSIAAADEDVHHIAVGRTTAEACLRLQLDAFMPDGRDPELVVRHLARFRAQEKRT